ncbi:MAG: response regulator [Silvanigrellales bacterium]|nr:response regulator [Silvanigrellales bacterium]
MSTTPHTEGVGTAETCGAFDKKARVLVVDDTAENLEFLEATLQGLRILLAEDSPFISAFVARVLEDAGAKVELACDGQEAVEAMENEDFDVALIDLDMPLLSGKEVVQHARRRRYPTATLVAFTATSTEEANRQAVAAGFDGAISKPVEKEALVRAIHLLHQRRCVNQMREQHDRSCDAHAETTP